MSSFGNVHTKHTLIHVICICMYVSLIFRFIIIISVESEILEKMEIIVRFTRKILIIEENAGLRFSGK